MSDTIRRRRLYRSSVVAVRDVCCRPHDASCGGEEFSTSADVVFPRSGAFLWHIRGEEVLGDAHHVLFFPLGEPYRVSHPVSGGDDCTVFSFASEVLADAFASVDPAVRDAPERPFRAVHCRVSAMSVAVQQGLRRVLCSGNDAAPDPLAVDEVSLRLLAAVAEASGRRQSLRPARLRGDTVRWHRAVAAETRKLLLLRFHEPLTLPEIARQVHVSPFHLARVFRREAGVSLHRYVTQLRLRAAMERLADGNGDLSQLALSLGFCSHSHFTDSFQRAFHVSPAEFRDRLTTQRLREMSKNLEAPASVVA
ncbi:MAG: helix-turn-helix transcriptional regulator [Planctomycetes bacterium]|nr:helix-turn-helix transcriptional regulator [Planctomycetota bacterium]